MSSAAHYSQAAFPEPFTILGIRLQHLSLNNYMLMHRHGVAFVSESETVAGLDDLISGVLICSKHWQSGEFEEYLSSGSFKKELAAWGKKVIKSVYRKKDLLQKIQLFNQYIIDGSAVPPHWKLEAGKSSGAHWTQSLLNSLISHCGYSKQEALHGSLKQAIADFFFHAESQGLIQLASESELELIAKSEKEAQLANA